MNSHSILYLVPKNWLSRGVGWVVRRRWPFGLHRRIRDLFIRRFRVDATEAELPVNQYPTLGEFFVRRLRQGTRLIGAADLVSPVDGTLTQRGRLENAALRLTQIKGIAYSLKELIGGGWDPEAYAGGYFLTLYLAPWNYHRIHSPVAGRVLRARHIAGSLWPVNDWSVRNIPDLFVRNDRMLVEMRSDAGGRVLLALVGATNVGCVTLSFCPHLRGNSSVGPGLRDWHPPGEVRLEKGEDLGCFEMGSTVVMVLDASWIGGLREKSWGTGPFPVRMGQDLSE